MQPWAEEKLERDVFAIVDEAGGDVPNGQGGILVIKKPWPSMIRTIWGDPERFKKTYYPEDFQGRYYLAGDGATTVRYTGAFEPTLLTRPIARMVEKQVRTGWTGGLAGLAAHVTA